MQTVKNMAAQGDVMFIRCDEIPVDAQEVDDLIVAHSETGHHHIVEYGASVLERPRLFKKDDFTSYLKVPAPYVEVVHNRNFDTHETLRLLVGNWEIRRQREYAPLGVRRVED